MFKAIRIVVSRYLRKMFKMKISEIFGRRLYTASCGIRDEWSSGRCTPLYYLNLGDFNEPFKVPIWCTIKVFLSKIKSTKSMETSFEFNNFIERSGSFGNAGCISSWLVVNTAPRGIRMTIGKARLTINLPFFGFWWRQFLSSKSIDINNVYKSIICMLWILFRKKTYWFGI